MPFRTISDGVPPAPSFFAEIVDYIGFSAEDSAHLLEFLPVAQRHFPAISEHFYERILAHPGAHDAIKGGHEQIERLKQSLVQWMHSGLTGPHDQDFCMRRARIGHIHVRIGLPQRYMITAMNVMRLDFRRVVEQELVEAPLARLRALNDALDRLFDLELAIMLETYKLEAEDRLRRRERLATIGQLAASIGHDLRNPLSVMESSLYILRRRSKDDERALKHVDRIGHQIDECDSIITHLLEMARNQPPRRDRVDLAGLVQDALSAARVPARVRVERHGLDGLVLWIDAALIKQALVNLLINSVQAQREGEGWISIRASRQDDNVVIALEDTGPGFDAATLPIIFEPLVTTKATGTGLGLSLVKSVIERHSGHVSASNRVGGGAMVKLHLPDAIPEQTPS
jgi:two-component system sensor histidine kinase HydH